MRTWTTDELPVSDQFGYWRDVICEQFTPLSPRRGDGPGPDPGGLRGWVRSSPLRRTNCAVVGSSAQRHVHGVPEVRRTPTDSVFVNLVLDGACVGRQHGRTCRIGAGEFALFDTTEPFSLDYVEDWEVLSFRLPRDSVLPLLARPDRATAVTFSGTTGPTAAVVSMMHATWGTADGLDPATAAAMEDAFAAVLAAALGATAGAAELGRDSMDAALRRAVHRHVRHNLRRGDLSAHTVARHLGISVRKLHALYEQRELTYGRLVRRMRLEACAREVVGSAGTLTAIAANWGFSDLSHLNRVFRSEFGCRPSEYRAVHGRSTS
ncbi:helix-turn-helix domain-containing protein [Pseudonocardia alni]|uniref:AraC-like ligand-binding domain-containing protein n=1 Tax=Pseudonocardia alni TaxID=33907 RepID=UPI00280BA2D0|nr:helix-turn-helix domain-containing protein [Pseudonocardia alni]